MTNPLLCLRPEYGHPTSLWADIVPFPRSGPRVVTYPDEMELSEELGDRLYRWTRLWHENFLGREDRPDGQLRWRPGFNIEEWTDEGLWIEKALISELPEYDFDFLWRHWVPGYFSGDN
ncbi:hypothetical protein CATRI_05980 [Corynebacterium atrinae]|uniref:hypothetical protein n=1 Tax=Corynebacterium atrinae TaxID=1336740 RepID=UPI0025B382F3|nr:hypothetical protein [Corynebacterium atrinae]WJY63284.1 hypothetical protein CATRI_05980 [Corynebacterium atrinae]